MKKCINKITLLKYIIIPFKMVPILTLLSLGITVLKAIVPTYLIYIQSLFIDESIVAIKNNQPISSVSNILINMVLALFAIEIISAFGTLVSNRLNLRLKIKLSTQILNKKSKLLYYYIEDNETWNLISRVQKDPDKRIAAGYSNLLFLFSLVLRIAGIMLLLIESAWWVVFIIVACTIPLIKMAIKSGRAEYDVEKKLSKKNRKLKYISSILTSRDCVDERHLFKYTKIINDLWLKSYVEVNKEKLSVLKKWFVKMKLNGIYIAVVSFVMIGFGAQYIPDIIKPGAYISILNAILNLMQSLTWDLTDAIDQLEVEKQYMKDYDHFFSLQEMSDNTGEIEINKFNDLEFENVWFKYPNTDNFILKGLSFKVSACKHYAFVGINGAGKTTIVKLILKLFKPNKGTIKINGIDIQNITSEELSNLLSVVFQDFSQYQLSIKDNITLGRNANETVRLNRVIEIAGLHDLIEHLPNGVNTILGKLDSNGVEVSGGEWQKIALARSLYNNLSFTILDEPTAALDPISEDNLYKEYLRLYKNQTTIMISHRLGSTKLADIIYVIFDGKVVENGSYVELMSEGGYYAEMFNEQKKWYIQEEFI